MCFEITSSATSNWRVEPFETSKESCALLLRAQICESARVSSSPMLPPPASSSLLLLLFMFPLKTQATHLAHVRSARRRLLRRPNRIMASQVGRERTWPRKQTAGSSISSNVIARQQPEATTTRGRLVCCCKCSVAAAAAAADDEWKRASWMCQTLTVACKPVQVVGVGKITLIVSTVANTI